jgi:hypothetical protein
MTGWSGDSAPLTRTWHPPHMLCCSPGRHKSWGEGALEGEAPRKCHFFLWLVLHSRNWTSEHAWCHGLHDDALCVLCDQGAEMMDHLLVGCPYVREVWFKVLWHCGWQGFAPANQKSFC